MQSIGKIPALPNKQKAEHKPVTPSPSSRPGSHDLAEYTSPWSRGFAVGIMDPGSICFITSTTLDV